MLISVQLAASRESIIFNVTVFSLEEDTDR